MKFRTEIEIKPFAEKIDHRSQIFAIGSCFAQNMSNRLSRVKLNSHLCPTGILFNPASIDSALHRIAENRKVTQNDLCYGNECWFSYDFHSDFSGSDPYCVEDRINVEIQRAHDYLRRADWVIITFGTAWVYTLNNCGEVVANCHKQPASNFTRRRLSVEEIVGMYTKLMQSILADKQVIFTISPVRHLGDGADENFLSKATLKVAVAEIVEKFENAHYFPSYEILNDDLRDYRFYDEDLVHPSQQAVEYICDKFFAVALSKPTLEILPRIEKIIKAFNHLPREKYSISYANFCRQQLDNIDSLPEVNFDIEREYFEREIHEISNKLQ